MNYKKIDYFKEEYKARFDEVHLREIYKWKAFKCFQDNWDINSSDFTSMLKASLDKTGNLLSAGNFLPKSMLFQNSEKSPEQVRELFRLLVDEEEDLLNRINEFLSGIKKINALNFTGMQSYHQHLAVMAYLSLIYPERYYLYKFGMFRDFVEKIQYSYEPAKGKDENIGQYLNMCELVRNELVKDQTLLKLHKNRIDEDCYYDKNYNLLTQDFIYAVAIHLTDYEAIPEENRLSDDYTTPTITTLSKENIIAPKGKSNFNAKLTNIKRQQRQNKITGDAGEVWLVKYLKNEKKNSKVYHTSVEKGDGAGYDVKLVNKDDNVKYIEVKTTKGKCSTPFYITKTELNRSIKEKEKYYLYRLYEYDKEKDIYKIAIINGDLTLFCGYPESYRVSVKN
jgi:hypothetical protein